MNVNDAAAGATRLTSPHDNANNKLKNAAAIAVTPRKKFEFERIRPITLHNPDRRNNACTSPTCFIARASNTSPTTEASATATIALHV